MGLCIYRYTHTYAQYYKIVFADIQGQLINNLAKQIHFDHVGVVRFSIDFPKEFSSDNIKNPEIIVQEGENVSVTLLCKANILNGIASWKNVTYKIEWFAEGNSLQVEKICGGIPPGSSNDDACPNGPLVSKLSGSKYKIGNWVSRNNSNFASTVDQDYKRKLII